MPTETGNSLPPPDHRTGWHPFGWWALNVQAQKTGHCPFCGAALPKIRLPMYSLGGIPGAPAYASVCPNCGRSSFPFRAKAQVVLAVLVYVAVAMYLLFAFGARPLAVDLLITLVAVFVPIVVFLVRRGGVANYFNAMCLLVGLGIASYTLLPAIFPTARPTVSASVAMPRQEETGTPVTAVISVQNTAGSDVFPTLDWPDHDTASALDTRISTADWQLQRVSQDGQALQLQLDDVYDLGVLGSGESTAVTLNLKPLHPGKHRFRAEVYDSNSGDNVVPTELSVAAVVHGARVPPPPPPSYSVTMRASMPARQVKGEALPLRLVIRNTGTLISNVHINLSDAIAVNSMFLSDFQDVDWEVEGIAVNGQDIYASDDATPGEYDLGALPSGHVIRVNAVLVPRLAGTHDQVIEVYNRDETGKPLATDRLRATVVSSASTVGRDHGSSTGHR